MTKATHERHNSREARPGAALTARSSTAPAEVVESLACHDDKSGTTLHTLPGILTGQRGPRLPQRLMAYRHWRR
jgi:hypothetical protein